MILDTPIVLTQKDASLILNTKPAPATDFPKTSKWFNDKTTIMSDEESLLWAKNLE